MDIDIKLSRAERMLFALLRYSLSGEFDNRDMELFSDAGKKDWDACYALAKSHGVKALAWDGVMLLPKQEWRAYDDLRIIWFLDVERYENTYQYFCQTASELMDFYREHGIATVQLKGVGFSSYYPTPSHREGGDIDIYTYSMDRTKMSDKEANNLADQLMREQGIEVELTTSKHSEFNYKNIPIENHKSFLDVKKIKNIYKIEETLHEVMRPVETKLCDEYNVMVPSTEFNSIFIGIHAARHYTQGLALHHLYDWACILKKDGLNIHENAQDERFMRFIKAFTYISNQTLGTQIEVDCDKELAKDILESLLHNPYEDKYMPKKKVAIALFKIKRKLYEYNHCKNLICEPAYLILWGMIKRRFK